MSVLKKIALFGLNPALGFYRRRIQGLSHQRRDMQRTVEKWKLIEPELRDRAGSLLDIGCNEGYFYQQAALGGWCTWGLDVLPNAVNYAATESARSGVENAFFSQGLMTPLVAKHLPHFDVILLLSTFQEIFSVYGRTAAYELFADLLRACRRKLIFEPASTNGNYQAPPPVFDRDNDCSAIEAWVWELASTVPGWKVRYVGATAYTQLEPHRFLFVIERDTSTDPANHS